MKMYKSATLLAVGALSFGLHACDGVPAQPSTEADAKKAAALSQVAKQKVSVRVCYCPFAVNTGESNCIVDGEIEIPNAEISLGEIRKLAAKAHLVHLGAPSNAECLQRIRAALASEYTTFNCGAGWLGSEKGQPSDKLSKFKKENQTSVYFSN